MTRKIGVYPGTFDPVHAGHIAFSDETLKVCGLDEIIFLPDPSPRGKSDASHILQRVALLSEATAPIENLRVMHLGDETFTVHGTLPQLREQFGDCELTLLVGSDIVRTFLYRWEGLNVLLRQMPLAIGMRTGDSPDEMRAIIGGLEREHNISIPYELIDTQHANISSSQLKNS
jgi:nicotinate-nucleotide adenylyltransferase